MKKFIVIVTLDVTESAVVTVFAETAEEAEEKALTKAAIEGTWWERDDCPSAEPYITDCEEIS